MLITIDFPWYIAFKVNRKTDIVSVDTVPTEHDGDVAMGGVARSILDGSECPLPLYIAAKDIPGYIMARYGIDYGTHDGARMD